MRGWNVAIHSVGRCTCRESYVHIHIAVGLIPLINQSPFVVELMPCTGSKSVHFLTFSYWSIARCKSFLPCREWFRNKWTRCKAFICIVQIPVSEFIFGKNELTILRLSCCASVPTWTRKMKKSAEAGIDEKIVAAAEEEMRRPAPGSASRSLKKRKRGGWLFI